MISLTPNTDPHAKRPSAAAQGTEADPDTAAETPPVPPADHEESESGADPEPSTAPVDPDGDTDPGASNTGEVHPL